MTGPGGGFDAAVAAIETTAEQMGRVQGALGVVAEGLGGGATTAAGAAGAGPLSGALEALAAGARDRATELGTQTAQLAKALGESAEAYRRSDAGAGGQLAGVSFGGVTG